MENLTLFPLYQTTCFFIPLVAPCTPLLRFIDTDFRGSNPEFIIDIWNTCPADALTLSVKAESRTEKGAVLYEADYRPIAENLPPMIRFDSAYHRALEKSANKSAGRTKNKAQP